jgi:hypothetical protein
MSFDDDPTPSTPGRILLFVLASVLALVLPLVVMRQVFGAGEPASPGPLVPTAAPPTLGAGADALTASSLSGPSPDPAGRAAATGAAGPQGATGATGFATLAEAAETCRLANLRQQAPLSAAAVSLAQFDKHIDAMNLLVAGKISLSVATTFWDQTRVKAAENATAFRRADQELAGNTASCPALDPAVADAAPYGDVVAIKSCAVAITARNAALARARTAVTTWEHHVHDMEMLRMGHLTPAQATAAWRKNWKTGESQLAAYEKAAARASKVPCSLD